MDTCFSPVSFQEFAASYGFVHMTILPDTLEQIERLKGL